MSLPSGGLTATFLALHIAGGIVGLPLVVSTIVASHKPSRHPTLLNFCATWFFSSVIYTLLLYAGKQNDHHPPFGLCLAQASMASGAFPMTSIAGVALVAHIWHGLGPARPWSQFGLASKNLQTTRLIGLLIAPYAVFLLFVIPAAVIGHRNPGRIQNQDKLFYCTVDSTGLNVVGEILVMVSMAFILLFEVLICAEIFQNTYIKSGLNRSGFRLFFVRLLGFAIYAIISLIVAALLVHNNRSLPPYILQASLPICVFIFIGTQKEVLATWSRFLPFSLCSNDHYDGSYHQNRSTTTLTRDDRTPTPAFMLNELKSDGSVEDNSAEIFKSSEDCKQSKKSYVEKGEGADYDLWKQAAISTSAVHMNEDARAHLSKERQVLELLPAAFHRLCHCLDHARHGSWRVLLGHDGCRKPWMLDVDGVALRANQPYRTDVSIRLSYQARLIFLLLLHA